jgi:hypothetical protein
MQQRAQNLPNNFIYAVAAAVGITYTSAFTETRKGGRRMVKLWDVGQDFTKDMSQEFASIVKAALPGADVQEVAPGLGFYGSRSSVRVTYTV